MNNRQKRRLQSETAARAALKDVTQFGAASNSQSDELEGTKLVELLRRNFQRLDQNNDGISRAELMQALMTPAQFCVDEYTMIKLLIRYFDMLINLADDQPGQETRITRVDCDVLAQFMLHGKFSLETLESWLKASAGELTDKDVGPPPLFNS